MKTKTFKKKLNLNKNTIADLSNGQLGHVKGGCVDTFPSCPIKPVSEDPTCLVTCATCETCVTCVTCVTCQTCFGQNTCAPNIQCMEPTIPTR